MNYEVGKYYKVPIAILLNEDGKPCGKIPVVGPPHNDKQFGFAETHLHVDGRFVSNSDHHYKTDEEGKTNAVIIFGRPNKHIRLYSTEIVYRRRKCKRLTTGIKPPAMANKYWTWRSSMIGKSCAGKKCPHLGADMIDNGTSLVCPLHNLIGCRTKEIIIE